ncbi:MAG: YdiU family protein [Nevskiales bacterium]|nr:YdiU family protein [Nevskiales bacterium]
MDASTTESPASDAATAGPHRIDALPVENRYARLGEPFCVRTEPTPLTRPRLLHVNAVLLRQLGLGHDEAVRPEFTEILSGNRPLPGGEPLSMRYAGHQFGAWVPQLGDGRAILLGQLRDRHGVLQDLQLKGAGRTAFSRFGDGRAVLRSSVREYLAGEALHHLGIPSTRALSLIVGDDPVRRETIEPAAVICRVAPSHVRFGHFEAFSYAGDVSALRRLADHVIDEHHPDLSERPDRYTMWLRWVVDRTAGLMAQWQAVGFCHGVMNTDNMSILGLTLDYGPYGFLDGFDAHHVCNHSDHAGRYAYDQQPVVGHWNCARLIQACLPLLAEAPQSAAEIGQAVLDRYPDAYATAMTRRWRAKFGLKDERDGDPDLINHFLSLLHRGHDDFTGSFRALADVDTARDAVPPPLRERLHDVEAFDAWLEHYRDRLRGEHSDDAQRRAEMNRTNPKYVLRNHLAQDVIAAAASGDTAPLDRLLTLLRRPYDEHPGLDHYADEPPPEARHLVLSCSS